MAEEAVKTSTEMTQPVIIDLGKQRSRTLKDLKQGEGKLWDEVLDVVDEVKEMLGAEVTRVQDNLRGAPQIDVSIGGRTVTVNAETGYVQ